MLKSTDIRDFAMNQARLHIPSEGVALLLVVHLGHASPADFVAQESLAGIWATMYSSKLPRKEKRLACVPIHSSSVRQATPSGMSRTRTVPRGLSA
jgi:hypothetical protein